VTLTACRPDVAVRGDVPCAVEEPSAPSSGVSTKTRTLWPSGTRGGQSPVVIEPEWAWPTQAGQRDADGRRTCIHGANFHVRKQARAANAVASTAAPNLDFILANRFETQEEPRATVDDRWFGPAPAPGFQDFE
jgi:hypothetical protein